MERNDRDEDSRCFRMLGTALGWRFEGYADFALFGKCGHPFYFSENTLAYLDDGVACMLGWKSLAGGFLFYGV
jgi:hypothetical protein